MVIRSKGGVMWSEKEMQRKCGEWILEANGYKKREVELWPWALFVALLALTIASLLGTCAWAGEITECSYYTKASCLREGTSGIMANGKVLRDEGFTAASWDYKQRKRVQDKQLY